MIGLVAVSTIPLLLMYLYCKNLDKLDHDSFKDKFGAGLEGVNLKKKEDRWTILAFPVFFFGRRLAFVASVVLLGNFLWAQLASQMMISVFYIIYLMWYRPLESPFEIRMEVMNECTVICLLYNMMCFTDFVPEPETRS